MSNCNRELYDYGLVKKCCRCNNILSKSIFHKQLSSKDGLDPQCIPHVKNYYLDNRDRVMQYYLINQTRLKNYQEKYIYENKEKIKFIY